MLKSYKKLLSKLSVLPKFVFNASGLMIIQIFSDLSGLVFYVVLSRNYGPEGTGIYAFGYAVSMLVALIVNFGFDNYGIRECASLDEDKRRILIGDIITTQVFILLATIAVFFIYIMITAPALKSIIVIISLLIFLILQVFSDTFFMSSIAHQFMIYPAMTNLVTKVVTVITAVSLMVFFNAPIYIAILPFPVFGVFLLFIAFLSAKKFSGKLKLNFNWKKSFSLMKITLPFTGSNFINQIYSRAGLIIVTILLGNSIAGIYSSAQKFMEVGLMPVSFLGFSIYPVLSKYFKKNRENFENSVENFFRAIFIIAALLLWGLYYIVPEIIIPIFGAKFSNSLHLVKYFAVLIFIYSLSTSFYKLFLAANLQLQSVKFEFAALIINLILCFTLIPSQGPTGAVIALIVSECVLNILYISALYIKDIILFKKLLHTLSEYVVLLFIPIVFAALIPFFIYIKWITIFSTLILFLTLIYFSGFIRKFKVVKEKI